MGLGVLEQHQDLGIQKKEQIWTGFYVVRPNLLILGPYLMVFSGVMIFKLAVRLLDKQSF